MRNDVILVDRLLSQVKGQCKRGYRFGHPCSQETLLSSLLLILRDTDPFVWGFDCPSICMCIKSKPPQVVDLQRFNFAIGGERGNITYIITCCHLKSKTISITALYISTLK